MNERILVPKKLEAMFGDKKIEITELNIRQVIEVNELMKEAMKEMEKANGQDIDPFNLIANNLELNAKLISIATGESLEDVMKLPKSQFQDLLNKILEVNNDLTDFFAANLAGIVLQTQVKTGVLVKTMVDQIEKQISAKSSNSSQQPTAGQSKKS